MSKLLLFTLFVFGIFHFAFSHAQTHRHERQSGYSQLQQFLWRCSISSILSLLSAPPHQVFSFPWAAGPPPMPYTKEFTLFNSLKIYSALPTRPLLFIPTQTKSQAWGSLILVWPRSVELKELNDADLLSKSSFNEIRSNNKIHTYTHLSNYYIGPRSLNIIYRIRNNQGTLSVASFGVGSWNLQSSSVVFLFLLLFSTCLI